MSGEDGSSGAQRRVVVGVDDTAQGLAALRRAVGMARDGHAQLVAVRSWELGLPRHGGRRHRHVRHRAMALEYHGAQQRRNSGGLVRRAFRIASGGIPADIPVTIRTPHGDPGVALTAIASPGDVLVLGSGRRHSVGREVRCLVHGSVSRYCQEHARCRVVLVPAGVSAGPSSRASTAGGSGGSSPWASTASTQ
jgi:nucleotide-binding universal stress UspA family protein